MHWIKFYKNPLNYFFLKFKKEGDNSAKNELAKAHAHGGGTSHTLPRLLTFLAFLV